MSSFDLVTGASGFIGRHLAERLLEDGRTVGVLCRPSSVAKLSPMIRGNARIIKGDLRDRESLRAAAHGARMIFHCAGHVSDWGADEEFVQSNVQATEWLLDAAAEKSVERFVHLSSIAVFGVPSPPFFDDETPYGPGRDGYSRTKIEGEKRVLRSHAEKGLPVTILRPAVVYGPYGTWVEEPLRMIRQNRIFLIKGGTGTCHPCYIENLVDAILLAAGRPEAIGQAYIVGDDESISFRRYFDYLAAMEAKAPIRRSIPLPAARAMATAFEALARLNKSSSRPLLTHAAIDMVTTTSRMSMEKIRKDLGFKPRFTVEAAMSRLQEFYIRQSKPDLAKQCG